MTERGARAAHGVAGIDDAAASFGSLARLAGALDQLTARLVVEPRFVGRRTTDAARRLAEGLLRYADLDESDWLAAPPQLEPTCTKEGLYRGRPTKTVEWSMPMPAAAAHLEVALRSLGPQATRFGLGQPAIWVLVHGWLGGSRYATSFEWPFDVMLESYDLCRYTLPGHGARRVGGAWPGFPTRNPFANAVGIATATAELRQLVEWLRRVGYARVGVAGTSVGGNVVALLATTPVALDRVLLDRPLVRMSEVMRGLASRAELRPSSRTPASAELRSLATLLERIYAPTDPLLRSPQIPPDRIDALVGCVDAIVGTSGGEALAERWGMVPRRFPGGHVLSFGRKRALLEMLHEL